MPKLDRLFYIIDAETKGFDEGVIKSGQKLRSFTEYAAGHPVVVMGALSAAFLLAGAKAVQMAAQFEKSMKMVQTVTDTTTVSMQDLSNGVLKTFQSLPITSLDEMTKGLYDIISSGVPAGDAIEYLNTAAKAAVGGVTSVATAVDGLTSATNAWAAQGLTATQASDQMFQAVNKGKLTFEQVSSTIGEVAGAAAGLNVSLADVLAVQAQLTLSGYSAAEAMTAVRQMMQEIVHPTGQLQQQFPDLARQFTRAKLEGEGLVGFLLDFQKASHGNGAAMSALFSGVQGQFGAMALLKDQGVGLVKMLEDVKNSEGAAATAAKIMGSSAVDTEQVLKNKLHAELVRGGSAVLPAWMIALKGATALLKAYNDEANNVRHVDFAKDVGSKAGDFAAGTLSDTDANRVRGDLTGLYERVKAGAVDTSQLTIEQLRALRDAYAKETADILGVTVAEFQQTQALIARIPTTTGSAADQPTTQQAYQFFATLTQQRQQADDAAAAATKKNADARVQALGQEGAQLATIVRQGAEAAKVYRGMGDQATRAQSARAGALDAIASAEASVADAQTKLARAVEGHDEKGAKAALAQMRAAQTAINDQHQILTTAGEELTQAGKKMANARVALQNAADEYLRQGEKSPLEEAENKIRSLVQEAKNAHVELSSIDSAVATIRAGAALMTQRNARALMEDIQGQLIAATGDVVQQAQRAAEEQIRTLGERIQLSRTLTVEQKAQAGAELTALQAALKTKVVMTSIQQGLDDLSQHDAENQARGILPSVGDLNATIALAMRANAVLNDQTASSEDQRKARALLLAIDQKRLDLLLRQAGVVSQGAAAEAALRRQETARIQDQAQGVRNVVTMAGQLASAFGLVDAQFVSMLDNIGQIATNILPLLDAARNFNVSDGASGFLTSFGSLTAAAMPIVSGIASLLQGMGEDPAAIKAREANTEAIKRLTDRVGDLSKADVSGGEVGRVASGLSALFRTPEWKQLTSIFKNGGKIDGMTGLDAIFRQFGTTRQEVEDVAKALGISLVSLKDYEKVLEAINAADLASYTDTFAGSMQSLSDTFRAFNITDPAEKIRRTLAALTNPKTGIPGLATALAGIDLTNAEGVQAGIEAAQQFFDDLASGKITAAQLGGASISDARQATLDFLDLLRSGGSAATGTGGFNVSQQITEVTGARIGAILSTSQIFLQQIADNTAIAARMLGGSPSVVTPILPPVVTAPTSAPTSAPGGSTAGGSSAGGGVSVGEINVHIHTTDLTDPQLTTSAARQAGTAVVAELDRALGTQLQWRARGRGTVSR